MQFFSMIAHLFLVPLRQGFSRLGSCLGVYLAALFLFSGCLEPSDYAKRQRAWLEHPRGLRVLCTTEMVQALVEAIGAEHIDTLALVYGELDPHSYQLVKGDDEKISKAQVIFCNGLGLEHGPSLKSALERHSNIFYLGDELAQEDPSRIIQHGPSQDPHFWLDVGLFAKCCPLIADHLAQVDPSHKEAYFAKAQEVQQTLEKIDLDLKARFQAIASNRRYLVTSHEAFFYLTRAYLASPEELLSSQAQKQIWRERFCAPEGLAPESQISLHRILEIAEYIKRYKVPSAFLEINVNSDAVYKIQEVLASEGVAVRVPSKPLYSDCMPPITSEEVQVSKAYLRYLEMIQSNAEVILNHLEGADAR